MALYLPPEMLCCTFDQICSVQNHLISLIQDEDESIYDTIEDLRDRVTELRLKITGGAGESPDHLDSYKQELVSAQSALIKQKEERKKRYVNRMSAVNKPSTKIKIS